MLVITDDKLERYKDEISSVYGINLCGLIRGDRYMAC